MGLVEIAASFAAALLIGVLARGTWRTTLLLLPSLLAVYWFQPLIPLRSFDFWLPTLTLALVILTWLVTSKADVWQAPHNFYILLLIVGVATFVNLSRYFLPASILTATTPPPFIQYLAFVLLLSVVILSLFWLSKRRPSQAISTVIVLLVLI